MEDDLLVAIYFFEQVGGSLRVREREVERAREIIQRRQNASSRSSGSLSERHENL